MRRLTLSRASWPTAFSGAGAGSGIEASPGKGADRGVRRLLLVHLLPAGAAIALVLIAVVPLAACEVMQAAVVPAVVTESATPRLSVQRVFHSTTAVSTRPGRQESTTTGGRSSGLAANAPRNRTVPSCSPKPSRL
jgi:hypothetical protein